MRMYYVKKAPDPALLEGRQELRASDFDEFYAIRFDFNETSDARPPRGWGGVQRSHGSGSA